MQPTATHGFSAYELWFLFTTCFIRRKCLYLILRYQVVCFYLIPSSSFDVSKWMFLLNLGILKLIDYFKITAMTHMVSIDRNLFKMDWHSSNLHISNWISNPLTIFRLTDFFYALSFAHTALHECNHSILVERRISPKTTFHLSFSNLCIFDLEWLHSDGRIWNGRTRAFFHSTAFFLL